jgi:hypothetical protein
MEQEIKNHDININNRNDIDVDLEIVDEQVLIKLKRLNNLIYSFKLIGIIPKKLQ